jgi:hypothetical protein
LFCVCDLCSVGVDLANYIRTCVLVSILDFHIRSVGTVYHDECPAVSYLDSRRLLRRFFKDEQGLVLFLLRFRLSVSAVLGFFEVVENTIRHSASYVGLGQVGVGVAIPHCLQK